MGTVSVVYIGIPSYLAYCQECDWNYEKHSDHREGQRLIRKHVADTGHTVSLEKAVVVHYEPECTTQADGEEVA